MFIIFISKLFWFHILPFFLQPNQAPNGRRFFKMLCKLLSSFILTILISTILSTGSNQSIDAQREHSDFVNAFFRQSSLNISENTTANLDERKQHLVSNMRQKVVVSNSKLSAYLRGVSGFQISLIFLEFYILLFFDFFLNFQEVRKYRAEYLRDQVG